VVPAHDARVAHATIAKDRREASAPRIIALAPRIIAYACRIIAYAPGIVRIAHSVSASNPKKALVRYPEATTPFRITMIRLSGIHWGIE
jgi:hypothetical protein